MLLTTRDATLADLPTIVAIYNSTVASREVTADTEPVSVESRMSWFLAHTSHFRPIWVLEADDQIAGWLSFEPFKTRPAYNHTAEISIYLDQSFRGAGLGKFLIEKAINQSQSLGIKTLLGYIFGHNQVSLALFQKYGFQEWARLPKIAELDGVERDLLILGKRVW